MCCDAPLIADEDGIATSWAAKACRDGPTGSYAPLADGIRAYFEMVNSSGGIYGRQLKLTKVNDDQLGSNAQTVTRALAQDNAFATFSATNLFTGAQLLARANQPTFSWN